MEEINIKSKNSEEIKTAFEKNLRAMKLFPNTSIKTAKTRVRLLEGFKCEIEDGGWKIFADFNEKRGGKNEAPNPGILGRGAFGSCLVMGYVMWAAVLGIDFESIEIEIETDFDSRGEFGFKNISPGYSELRYRVIIKSDEDEDKLLSLINKSDYNSSLYDVFKNETNIKREIILNGEKI